MKKINFKQLLIATDITRKHCENIDCRENFANVLYRNGNGIASHALALKIYNSNEETEYSDEEGMAMMIFLGLEHSMGDEVEEGG